MHSRKLYNLHNFEFSFREFETSVETKKIFTMRKINDCFIENCGLYYVSDHDGFALLHLNTVEINSYYYDFE